MLTESDFLAIAVLGGQKATTEGSFANRFGGLARASRELASAAGVEATQRRFRAAIEKSYRNGNSQRTTCSLESCRSPRVSSKRSCSKSVSTAVMVTFRRRAARVWVLIATSTETSVTWPKLRA